MMNHMQAGAAIAVSLGAIAGALSRHYVGQELSQVLGTQFPWATFSINVSGCFFMGWVTTVAAHQNKVRPEILLFLTTGFLGAYTAFSAYVLDVSDLLARRRLVTGCLYWLGNPIGASLD